MFRINHLLHRALRFFLIDVSVLDASLTTTDGQDSYTQVARTIKAAVDPSGGRRLEVQFGGGISDGDIAIIPISDTLYIDDQYAEDSRSPQSFVVYEGWHYRVVEVQPWRAQANLQVYRATRHASQGQAA